MACELRLLPLQTTLPGVFSLYIINIYLTELMFEVNTYFQTCMLQKNSLKCLQSMKVSRCLCVCVASERSHEDWSGVGVASKSPRRETNAD